MIKEFSSAWEAAKPTIRQVFELGHPDSYEEILKTSLAAMTAAYAFDDIPDINRISVIDNGDWQGTFIFVIATESYQPDVYWYTRVYYGSCSGCDTLQGIAGYPSVGAIPSTQQVDDYMTLAMHLIQNIRRMYDIEEVTA